MKDIADALAKVSAFRQESKAILGPPEEGVLVYDCEVIARSLLRGTRGYIEKIGNQINGTYNQGWYDACAVLVRRLIETLIIEVFEKHNLEAKIKDQNGDYLFLKVLIGITLAETSWTLGRGTRQALPKLKEIGDKSAHSRRFVAQKSDIEKILDPLRDSVQELLFIAGLK